VLIKNQHEKNIENRIYRRSAHDGLPVAAAFHDSAEIRKFRHKNHSDRIDTDFLNCIIQPVYQKKKVESAIKQFAPGKKYRQHASYLGIKISLTHKTTILIVQT